MSQKTRNERYYQVLFVLCAALPYINFYELTFLVWGTVILLTFAKRYSLSIVKLCGYFIAILAVAFFSAFARDFQVYNFIRDIAYLLKPVMGLLVGYQLCKDNIRNPLNMVIYAAVFLAVGHIIMVGVSLTFFHVRNMHNLRQHAGYFSDFEVYALIILLFRDRFEVALPPRKARLFTVLIGFSCFLYLARTNFIQFMILWLAMKGYLKLNSRSVTILTSIILCSIIGYAAIYYSNPRRGSHGFEAFLYKIKIAPIEPFKTKVNRDDWKDFNDNYRSYENIHTVRQMSAAGTPAILFGQGLGSRVDLKQKVWLQSSEMRYIPFVHNGYMTVFLKSGLLGVIILLFSIAFFFRYSPSSDPLIANINYLYLGTGLFLIVSYWVFIGLYFVPDSKSVFLGFLIAYKGRLLRKSRTL